MTRNKQKRAKKARHERERNYMAHLRHVGHAVGEYVGDGQGDREVEVDMEEPPDRDAESDADEGLNDEEEDGSDNAHPLLFFYDCEATGLSIYDDNITDIAAKVMGVPLNSVSKPFFSSLVHTPHNIPKRGITITNLLSHEIYPSITCSVRHHWHYYDPPAPRTVLVHCTERVLDVALHNYKGSFRSL